MADMIELSANVRERVGKGASRGTRKQGLVPAVIYGDKQPPEPISLPYRDVWKQLQTGTFLSTVFVINVDGKKTRVIPRDVQVDPVRDFPVHVDFLRLGKNATISVAVPVHFLNEDSSPGLKRGGVLNIVRHEVELLCPADAIPESLAIDLDGLNIGDSVHISAVKLPEGTKPTITDRDFTVATIAGKGAQSDEEGEVEEAEEETEESSEEE